MLRRIGRLAARTAWLVPTLLAFAPARAVGGLAFLEIHRDGARGVDGLESARALTVSPDGAHLYAVSGEGDALVVFRCDPTSGALTFVELQRDGVDGVDGLDRARAVAVSPDGAHVYTAADLDDAIAVFRRDPVTGALTFLEWHRDNVGVLNGLDGSTGISVSGDGAHVYVAASEDDAITVFRRDPASGRLTFVDVEPDDVGGVLGIDRIQAVALSPDGANVYAASDRDDALAVFARDPASGELTFLEDHEDGSLGVDGLDAAKSVVVSPDGVHLYVAARLDDAIAIFARHPATGRLTFLGLVRDGVDGIDGLDGVESVALSGDGAYLYTAASEDNAVTAFRRDPASGALVFAGTQRNGVGPARALDGAETVAVSPDGRHVYASARRDDAVVAFSTRCGDARLEPDAGEQCDDGDTRAGDGCSGGCRRECLGGAGCEDGDSCSEERCREGQCTNPRCGLGGSSCELRDASLAMRTLPVCEPPPRQLRRALGRRLAQVQRLIRRASRRRSADAQRLARRADDRLAALLRRTARLERETTISGDCRSAIDAHVTVLGDELRDMLLARGVCAP
jgi:cysteine-rich repeat protein